MVYSHFNIYIHVMHVHVWVFQKSVENVLSQWEGRTWQTHKRADGVKNLKPPSAIVGRGLIKTEVSLKCLNLYFWYWNLSIKRFHQSLDEDRLAGKNRKKRKSSECSRSWLSSPYFVWKAHLSWKAKISQIEKMMITIMC